MELLRRFLRKGGNGKEPKGMEPTKVPLGLRKILADGEEVAIYDSVVLQLRDPDPDVVKQIGGAENVTLAKIYDIKEVKGDG